MAFEITCGQCGGRLVVEAAGVIVACPMCDAHLSVPDPDVESAAPLAEPPASEPLVAAMSSGQGGDPEPQTVPGRETAGGDVLDEPDPTQPTQWVSPVAPEPPEFVLPPEDEVGEGLFQVEENLPDFTIPADDNLAAPTVQLASQAQERREAEAPTLLANADAAPPMFAVEAATQLLAPQGDSSGLEDAATELLVSPTVLPRVTSAAPPVGAPPVESQPPIVQDMVPRQWFIMVAGYASAVTLALLYLLLTLTGRQEHALESLPDLVPPVDKAGNIGMKVVPPELDVAPGHELRLGETQRFGSLRVTPMRVSRSPIEFEHAFGKQGARREPTNPVLKLWLRFENVSSNQEFAPLDATLMFKRIFDRKSRGLVTLNFLGPVAERRPDGRLHLLFDLPEFSEYVLAGQDLNRPLRPREFWETYVPSEEGIAEIEGEWVWRVLFRKGFNPQSKRGVTTLIDVRFNAADVVTESEEPKTPPAG